VKASSGTSQRLEIKKGDLITLNYRNKPEKVNGAGMLPPRERFLSGPLHGKPQNNLRQKPSGQSPHVGFA
jgi:hypothetical protein